jgi:hypothetical protein
MKNLSVYIRDEFVKKLIDKLFDHCISIDTIEDVEDTISTIIYKPCSIVCKNSIIKQRLLDELSTSCPEINIINCNCSIEKFFDNNFSGFLVFDNLKRCQFSEIIEEIKKHKAILLS